MSSAAALLLSMTLLVTAGHGFAAGTAAACAPYGTDITGHVRGSLSEDQKTLDVVLANGSFRLTAVGVKGGGDHQMYTGGSFTGLTAPPNPGGNHPAISGWFACGVESAEPTTPPEPPTPTSTPEPTETPSPTESLSPTPEPTATPEPTQTPGSTETPDPTATAVPVPTSIPAGGPAAPPGSGSRSVLLMLGLGAMAAGGAALLARRRRRAHG